MCVRTKAKSSILSSLLGTHLENCYFLFRGHARLWGASGGGCAVCGGGLGAEEKAKAGALTRVLGTQHRARLGCENQDWRPAQTLSRRNVSRVWPSSVAHWRNHVYPFTRWVQSCHFSTHRHFRFSSCPYPTYPLSPTRSSTFAVPQCCCCWHQK